MQCVFFIPDIRIPGPSLLRINPKPVFIWPRFLWRNKRIYLGTHLISLLEDTEKKRIL